MTPFLPAPLPMRVPYGVQGEGRTHSLPRSQEAPTMTTRTVPTTPRHDGRHCGHVARSESPTVKRAAILAECVSTVEGFALSPSEPPAVVAVVEAILSAVPCNVLGEVATLAEWHGEALTWADATDAAYLVAPDLGILMYAAHRVASARAL